MKQIQEALSTAIAATTDFDEIKENLFASIWIDMEFATAGGQVMMIMPSLMLGVVHFVASNTDCGVRDFDMEKFEMSKHFWFPWPVNLQTACVDLLQLISFASTLSQLLLHFNFTFSHLIVLL
ncbi:unnamed protein product [Lactuca virosa]|uniref:Uncharacterized protein n=1 Tax=Lactuca virosa TaxID=75947 RepID=A0AAU9PHZ9_9ASTR|nr:unnamed protein product [Lactuca virosa]